MPRVDNQKIKLMFIADYLMKQTDPDNAVFAYEIEAYLKEHDISAERHSITRDIQLLRDFFKMDIVGGNGQPYYLRSREVKINDLNTIAECIGAAKFISKTEAENLIEVLKKYCSTHQADKIKTDYYVAERQRHTQESLLEGLKIIRQAIKSNYKISFYYATRSIDDLSKIQYRRKGTRYIVSPYQVVLTDGNHYLIGYDETYKRILPYRIDRMRDIKPKLVPREGEDKYRKKNITDYAKQTFGMFMGGNAQEITILFDNSLLDAVYDRFGKNAINRYEKYDDKHFTLKTWIVSSINFYGWLCGFGDKAVITDPPEVADAFKMYLQKIIENYH